MDPHQHADRSRCRCPDRERTSLVQQECRQLTVRSSVTDADVDLTRTTEVQFCRSSVTVCWTSHPAGDIAHTIVDLR